MGPLGDPRHRPQRAPHVPGLAEGHGSALDILQPRGTRTHRRRTPHHRHTPEYLAAMYGEEVAGELAAGIAGGARRQRRAKEAALSGKA
jgi:hypothetical protein